MAAPFTLIVAGVTGAGTGGDLLTFPAPSATTTPYVDLASLTATLSADGNGGSMSFDVIETKTPVGGPWWRSGAVYDNARVQFFDSRCSSTTPIFLGYISGIEGRILENGVGSRATVSVEDADGWLQKTIIRNGTTGIRASSYVDSFIAGGDTSTDRAHINSLLAAAGVLQLTDSTSSTSTTTAATPNAVKSAYDLANAAVPKSTFTTKGDLIVASGSSAVARLAVGADTYVLTADSAATNGIKWAASAGGGVTSVTGTSPIASSGGTTPAISIQDGTTSQKGAVQLTDSANSTSTTTAATPNAVLQSTKDMQANLYASTTRIGNLPNWWVTSNAAQTSQRVLHMKHIPERNFTVSNISFISSTTAASGLTLCRFGIYTRSGTTFTLVARTASDTTIFAAQNTRYTRALDTTGGYPATYDFVAGNEYYVSVIQVGTTIANLLSAGTLSTAQQNAFVSLSYTQTGQTDLPSSSTGTVNNLTVYSEVS